jgi:hypothetical protein
MANPSSGELGWEWGPYDDYTDPVSLPPYIPGVNPGYVMPLSAYTSEYDYLHGNGHANIGAWIDAAAVQVGH